MEEESAADFLPASPPRPTSPPRQRPAGKGVKRPRPVPADLGPESDSDLPDLADFQATFELSDAEMIKLCTAYASYLKAVHRRVR